MKMLYHILAVVIVSIWGTTFVSTKVLLSHGLQPAEIFTMRFLMAYLLLILFSPKRRLWCNNLKDELKMVGLGITGGSLYFLTENVALEYAPASNVSLLVCTTPLVTILLMRLIYRNEKLSSRTMCGSLIALLGVALVVLNGHFVLQLNPKGDILAIMASLSWAIYTLLLYSVEKSYPNLMITRKVFGYGLLTILPWFMLYPPRFSLEILSQSAVWGNLLFLGIIASLVCYATWNAIVKNIGTTYSSNYLYINPIAATIAASLVLHEKITLAIALGTALILTGIALARTRNSTNKPKA
ncbi:MAG: DMT family transporter [Alistipes sp.]|nr:DMT family transporter [Alistipes sp.]